MIGLPKYAIFNIKCAYRIEELNFDDRRIIRPAYKNIGEIKSFIPLKDR
ncbi:hypothetical protein [Gilliamella sp. Occ3-1]